MQPLTMLPRLIPATARSCFRHVSAVRPNRPNSTMTPAKLRALISLYHQADTFITLENLSQRIDDAFVGPLRHAPMDAVIQQQTDFMTLKRLENELQRQRMEPKVMEPDMERGRNSSNNGVSWSGRTGSRDEKVMEALYGVERGQDGQILPGLDVLLEERERLEEDMEADRQALEEVQAPKSV
ncbi:hypothetical protein F5887DRAFT_935972 [Amanita rubescens]|nr:hypothetical protein F5887DRAFT_994729 [Amanita rubescens]KAF8351108.1 hypothetical protein F5887DRAFT_935972 [Amanita rubescens]